MLGREGEVGAGNGRREHDAVVAEAHFDDVGHAVGDANLTLAVAHGARGSGDVDGVLADAFAETLEAGTGAAAFDDGRREVKVFAERLGHDGGVGQHGRGTGDLDLVAGMGGRRGRQRQNRSGDVEEFHGCTPAITCGQSGGLGRN